MSAKKSIKEMNAGAGGAVQAGGSMDFFRERRNRKPKNKGAPFQEAVISPAGYGMVVTKKGKKKNNNYKYVTSEKKSESMLREAIRNLIFLNRIKYHEENAKREMEEQKLRKVIRYLLNENDGAVAKNLDTTGQTAAYKWMQKIEKTTFLNSFVNLVTSRRQRRAFKKIYLTGVKIYLDSLDQKYMILNPGSGQVASVGGQPPVNPAAAGGMPGPLAEQEQVHDAAAPVAKSIQASNDSVQDQAISSAVTAAGFGNIESMENYEDIRSAVNNARECLKQDLAQLDDLYFDLSMTNFSTQKGRQTNDRQDFRLFLIGDKLSNGGVGSIGNLQINFDKYNKENPITNNFPGDIPPDPSETDLPTMDVPANNQPPVDTAPPAGGLPPPPAAGEQPPPPPEGEEVPPQAEPQV